MTANDCRVGANCRALTNHRPAELSLPVDKRTGIVDVGEYARRPAKHIVSEINALKKRNVVLDLASIADTDARSNHNVLANYAVFADRNFTEDMTEVPNTCTCADCDAIIDISAFMDKYAGKPTIGLQVDPRV